MTAVLRTTTTRLLGSNIEHLYELDPNGELTLNDADRAELTRQAAAAYEKAADAILAPYGCQMLADGEIMAECVEDETLLEWDEESVREALSMIDVSEVLGNFDL